MTGVQVAQAPPKGSLVTWLLAPKQDGLGVGVGWAKWASPWKQGSEFVLASSPGALINQLG